MAKTFETLLSDLDQRVYQVKQLQLESLEEEKYNEKYKAGTFKLKTKSVRFRLAKITPKKIGQFVAFWEKDQTGKNQAFHFNGSPDFLVIHCFGGNNQEGQFVFPREVLLKKKILRNDSHQGKMGMRVYPSWDFPQSPQALKTQLWQSEYFIDLSKLSKLDQKKFFKLYDLT